MLQLLLKRCLELGARVAEPGEFTRRAFINDKLDLAQAESVADLIDATTAEAARCAVRSLRGRFSERIHELTHALIELRALVEATAFGARAIVERFRSEGVRIDGVIALGGVAKKSPGRPSPASLVFTWRYCPA